MAFALIKNLCHSISFMAVLFDGEDSKLKFGIRKANTKKIEEEETMRFAHRLMGVIYSIVNDNCLYKFDSESLVRHGCVIQRMRLYILNSLEQQ